MSSPTKPAALIVAGIAFLVAGANAGRAAADNAAKKLLVGDTKVEVVAKYQGDALPKPDKVLVYDFSVPSDVISIDDSAAAKVHRPRKVDGADANSPEGVAQQVQASFAKALVHELQQASVPVEQVQGGDTPAPPHVLVVQGDFTGIKQGNKTKRVLIGFGKGASDVQAHVTLSLAAEQEQQPTVLLEFNVKSRSGKKPGAAATVGAGAATLGTVSAGSAAAGVAAGGVVDRAASVEADASRMAKAVAKQIADLMRSQSWAAPRQSSGSR